MELNCASDLTPRRDAVAVAEGDSDCDFGGDGNGDANDAGGDLVSQFFATVCATSSDQAAPS